jgi:hypothetical protein
MLNKVWESSTEAATRQLPSAIGANGQARTTYPLRTSTRMPFRPRGAGPET